MKKDYISPYEKTNYSGVIRVRDTESGKMQSTITNRTVYRNTDINPDLTIPKGTKIGKEIVKEDTTNLERMSSGKSPVIIMENPDGTVSYERVELHHITGEELQPGSVYFTGKSRDGSLVELKSSIHDSPVIHNLNEKETSFRKDKTENVDKKGNTIRTSEKNYASIHYDKTRVQYWKDRAAEIKNERGNSNEKEEKGVSWLDKFKSNEPNKTDEQQSITEQRQSWLDSIKVDLSNTNNQNSNTSMSDETTSSSAPDPMEKGDERDAPGHSAQEADNEMGLENDGMDMDDGMEL